MLKFAAPAAFLIASIAFVAASTAGSDTVSRDPPAATTISPQMNIPVPDLTNRQVIAAIKVLGAQLAQQKELLLQIASRQDALEKQLDDRSNEVKANQHSISEMLRTTCIIANVAAQYAESIKSPHDDDEVHTRSVVPAIGECWKNRV